MVWQRLTVSAFFCGRGSPERMFEILVVVKNAGKTILDILVRL